MKASKTGMVLRLLGIGWYVAICIGGGGFGGLWLDRKLDLSPLLTLVGLGVGIALAVSGMYQMLTALLAVNSDSKDRENG